MQHPCQASLLRAVEGSPLAEGGTRTGGGAEPARTDLEQRRDQKITVEQMKELAETGALTLSDAQLVWRAKDRQDWTDLVFSIRPSTSRKRSIPRRSSTT